ncbi:hypothetical protein [Nocardia brasiliensis]|uniref:hypothetical protein n=1 Tax=Nocardia brasiliensis TaxID=37326 RepID=UPI002453D835|nr:hypothetical protein [Nocardia brasiliensis]
MEFGVSGARGEDHHDALGIESAGREQQCLGGRLIEPVRVVDQAEQRGVDGLLSQQ